MQVKKLPYQEYKSIYSKVPRLCVDLVIQSADGVLLIQRDIPPGEGLWHFPGGTILLGESIQKAANRICRDETGLDLQIDSLIDTMEFPEPSNQFFHAVSMAYLINKKTESLHLLPSDSTMAFFQHIPDQIIPEHRQLLLKHRIITT